MALNKRITEMVIQSTQGDVSINTNDRLNQS